MKEIIFVILEKFADWEVSFLSTALNNKKIAPHYVVKYASIDTKVKTSLGNLKILPDMTINEITDNAEGIILIGADNSWRNLDNKTNYEIIKIIKKFKKDGKVIGAICDAAYFLAINGLLNDCKHTLNNLDEIKNNENYKNHKNYICTEIEAVIDKKIVTASGVAPLSFAVNVLKALGDISEKNIDFLNNMYTIGFTKALEIYEEKVQKNQ